MAGQVNGVPAGYPSDVITTRTEMVHDGVDGNIWLLVGDGTGQRPEPPPNQSCAKRQGESDDESCHKQNIVEVSQTGVGNPLPTTNVCETTTKSVSQLSNEPNVSNVSHPNSYETHFPTLGKPLIRTTTVTRDKQTLHNNGSSIKSLTRERVCDEQLTPYECNVGQLTNGNFGRESQLTSNT